MSELSKSFVPKEHESSIIKLWEESGFFNPDNLNLPKDAQNYTIILPPPNVTDRLHLGHASMIAIEDLLIRYHRMKGFRTLWLPGTDHAAIATQTVVEKRLYKENGKTRHDLGREVFLQEVRAFALDTQKTIISQIKGMGASLDWSRLAFTLDEKRQTAVKKMFVDMYEAGALYRGERIVNWCPRCQSTLADDEVEYESKETILYTFKYDKNFPIEISTTRPETKLGDTAVAVNPKDERYAKFIGQTIEADFCGQKLKLKIIADHEVDMEFGTGALGVTPAHSMIDWRMAEENNLEIIKVIDEQGKIRQGFGNYSGKNIEEARALIIESLRANNLISKEEKIEHNLSKCYRCGTPIEPLPSLQWFVAVDKPLEKLKGKSLKQAALELATKREVSFVPERFAKRYQDWMTNLRDWCISRQIWFGHQIPVYYRPSAIAPDDKSRDEILVSEEKPLDEGWIQDEDTLDTWFSSGMWTFSTLAWPEQSEDLERFHPTSVLETGYEIITLWVSRMIMMSLFALGEKPFSTVYLHGMVLDKDGKKMSKSKGNGLDPIEVSEKYGSDAVRLSLLIGNTPGIDVRVSEEKIAGFRNFSNKLWNVSRYILSQPKPDKELNFEQLTKVEKWIISKLQKTILAFDTYVKAYNFSAAGEVLRDFIIDDLADWYLEASKFENSNEKSNVLYYILENILKLAHPLMPFVTEAIWQSYHDDLLMVAQWPKVNDKFIDNSSEKDFEKIKEIIVSIRNIRSEHKVPPSQSVKAFIYAGKETSSLEEYRILIESLRTGVSEALIKESGEAIKGALYDITMGIEIYLEVEVDIKKEKERLNKELEKVESLLSSLNDRLDNKEFISKAPKKIIDQENNKRQEYLEAIEKIKKRLSELL